MMRSDTITSHEVILVIFLPVIVSIAAGVLLYFLKARPIRSNWLAALLASIFIWSLYLLNGPVQESLIHPAWQVSRYRILSFEFELTLESWALALVFSGVFLVWLLLSTGNFQPSQSQDLAPLFGFYAIFTLALSASNGLTLILAWVLFDVGISIWRASRRKPYLQSLVFGMSSVLLLMLDTVLEIASTSGDTAAVQTSFFPTHPAILLAAVLRLISMALSEDARTEQRREGGITAFLGVLPAGLAIMLLVNAAPIDGGVEFLSLGIGGICAVIGLIVFKIWPENTPSSVVELFPYIGLLSMATLLPPSTQKGTFSAIGGLMAFGFLLHQLPAGQMGWQRWTYLVFPLVLSGLPFSLGGYLLSNWVGDQEIGIIIQLLSSICIGSIAALSWRKWKKFKIEELQLDRFTLSLQIFGFVALMVTIVISGWHLGYEAQPIAFLLFACIAAGAYFYSSDRWEMLRRESRLPYVETTSSRIGRFLAHFMIGVQGAYSFGVQLASDIIEGDGGTLWIIVILLLAILGLGNPGL